MSDCILSPDIQKVLREWNRVVITREFKIKIFEGGQSARVMKGTEPFQAIYC